MSTSGSQNADPPDADLQDAAPQDAVPETPTLEGLPTELRLKIFGYVLEDDNFDGRRVPSIGARTAYSYDGSLIQTCSLTRRVALMVNHKFASEALQVLFEKHGIRFACGLRYQRRIISRLPELYREKLISLDLRWKWRNLDPAGISYEDMYWNEAVPFFRQCIPTLEKLESLTVGLEHRPNFDQRLPHQTYYRVLLTFHAVRLVLQGRLQEVRLIYRAKEIVAFVNSYSAFYHLKDTPPDQWVFTAHHELLVRVEQSLIRHGYNVRLRELVKSCEMLNIDANSGPELHITFYLPQGFDVQVRKQLWLVSKEQRGAPEPDVGRKWYRSGNGLDPLLPPYN
ncbi:hypothetical protein K490DRAFT_67465 [Saccharata proteae CBS 121410]|uniref:Uncharacterized protein n=1 Tax=Saccharata proteae CBS 121410 TaxID=1314787 RepID=A0A9P4HU04_9PEZI|nr:hypothetical protein K490DRAFT_67465 [Saccharata proteae CBS 121410]